jgi:hypothetical protein
MLSLRDKKYEMLVERYLMSNIHTENMVFQAMYGMIAASIG